MNAISANKLVRLYPGNAVPALEGVDLELAVGGVALLMGPSGAGKSTLLQILACLDRPDSGSLSILGEDVMVASESKLAQIRARRVGMVFQHHLLPPGLAAQECVAAPLLWGSGLSPKDALARAEALLVSLGLTAAEIRRPVQNLSGGQRQRVAFARAIAPDPELLLADEPISQLDETTAKRALDELLHWAQQGDRTLVIAAHEDIPGLPDSTQRFRIQAGKLEAL